MARARKNVTRMRLAIGVLMVAVSPAQAADTFTVGECLSILGGLQALKYKGAQLFDPAPPPHDAGQYKLGPARLTVALDIAALSPIGDAANKAQQGFAAELPIVPSVEAFAPGESPERQAARTEAQKLQAENVRKSNDNYLRGMEKPCNVTLGRLKAKELKIGDGPDENAIPVTVLGALVPIVDIDK